MELRKFHVWIETLSGPISIDVEASEPTKAEESAYLKLSHKSGNTKGFRTIAIIPEPLNKSNNPYIRILEERS
jgi:hypothetical protein